MKDRQDQRLIVDILQEAAAALEGAGIESARSEAELLLGYCLEKTRTALYLAGNQCLSGSECQRFSELIKRRLQREPVAYITGEREFFSLNFLVTPAVLIPRPETEFLIESALARRNRDLPPGAILDLCCGSGVIAIVLARELGRSVVALDISAEALAIARQNAIRHKVAQRVALVQGDLSCCFSGASPFSLVVSNPPYVCREDIEQHLEPEVSGYEPHLALDGGTTGLDQIERICSLLPALLRPGGDCFIEIGCAQGAALRSLLADSVRQQIFAPVTILQDYSGRDRVAHIRRTMNDQTT
jgi:release factor glutamine methyltransferase